MTRPGSYRPENFVPCCGTCKHCFRVVGLPGRLCLHGDSFQITGTFQRSGKTLISIEGERVENLSENERQRFTAIRAVSYDDICNQWEGR